MIYSGYNEINENKLSQKQRDKLPNKVYGLPKDRKYPMPDKNHVKSAIAYFSKCPENKRKELAKNIQKQAKHYGIDLSDSELIGRYL